MVAQEEMYCRSLQYTQPPILPESWGIGLRENGMQGKKQTNNNKTVKGNIPFLSEEHNLGLDINLAIQSNQNRCVTHKTTDYIWKIYL